MSLQPPQLNAAARTVDNDAEPAPFKAKGSDKAEGTADQPAGSTASLFTAAVAAEPPRPRTGGAGALTGCKGCSETASVHVSPEKLERLVQLAVQNRPAASDDEYARRLAVCSGCQGLQYGTTCRYCGCLVAVRARLHDSGCPYPVKSRWEEENEASFSG